MAEAGDGKRRSAFRQRQQMISMRVNADEKSAIMQKARRAGYESPAAYLRDLLQGTPQPSPALRVLSGRLSRHGALLTGLAEVMVAGGQADIADKLRRMSADTAKLQRQIFMGGADAGESDR